MRALCVSIHDVAPATLDACRRIAAAVADVDPGIPLTLLIVPRYHGDTAPLSRDYRLWVEQRLRRGDALALHGYSHRDEMPRGRGGRFRRSVYTANEGEFSALTREEAAQRIALGRAWLEQQGWPADGFVAPAWLLSEGTWQALRETDFVYTTTLTRFHLLRSNRALAAPTLVYSARSVSRRTVSRVWNAALAAGTQRAPLLRFGFHPVDADHSALMSHALKLLARVARARHPMTKSDYARRVSSV